MENFGSGRWQNLRAALESDSALTAAYLFGSHARGTNTRMSDIDLAILFQSSINESCYFELRLEYIARIMGILLTERVDLVVLNNVPLHLAYEIVSNGILLLDWDPRQRAAFEADRIGRFLDFKPFLAVQVLAIKTHLSKGTYFD